MSNKSNGGEERDRRLKEGTLEIGPEVSPDEPRQ
jgi:hypothetical protein